MLPNEKETDRQKESGIEDQVETSDLASREASYEELAKQSKIMKKKILMGLGIAVAAVIVLFLIVTLVDFLIKRSNSRVPEGDYTFYPTYEGDIFENPQYMSLDRQIYYCENPAGDGIKQAVNEENLTDFDLNVTFLYLYLQSINYGDAEMYNAYFNENYYKENQPQAEFSPQMIYNTEICYQATENDGADKLVTYSLSYMIYRNDGSFRRDIGSNAARPQLITLRVSEAGNISIEKLITRYNVTV